MRSQIKLPLLIYDGDCDICGEWVRYWKKLTAGKIDYRPYQEVHEDFPGISTDEFKQAIQFVNSDGTVLAGAAATFAVYSKVSGSGLAARLYRTLPGFASASEFGYHFFSKYRGLLRFITHLFWGREREPAQYHLSTQIFLRLSGCIYLAAFVSFGVQITGLIGTEGVLPLEQYLPQLEQYLGAKAYWQTPMLFWFYLSDGVLQLTCLLGAFLSCLLIFNFFPRMVLILLYLLYLSLYYAGQTFMTFQWDLLLLETGFLAIFLPSGSRLVIWLYRWLLFRFMFLGGLVKIISRDPNWDGLTALNYHFETQPLPTAAAWYAHHLPEPLLMTGVALTLIVELILPFFIFFPRRFRMVAACCFIVFQSLIILTGNYNFFNLLTIIICLFLFDDAAIKSCLPGRLISLFAVQQKNTRYQTPGYIVIPVALVILFSSIEQMHTLMNPRHQAALSIVTRIILPWHITQNYGPFATMTTVRHEIVIEGSQDGLTWKEYHFKYKPGDVSLKPRRVILHQPRLDWQMWFAALSRPEQNPWFQNLLYQLLLDSRPVTGLLASNPFPDEAPALVRARYYEYHFTTPEKRKSTGQWWTRQLVADYYPPIRLSVSTKN